MTLRLPWLALPISGENPVGWQSRSSVLRGLVAWPVTRTRMWLASTRRRSVACCDGAEAISRLRGRGTSDDTSS